MFFDQIVSQTRADLEQRKSELPLEDLQHLAAAQPPPRDFLGALRPVSKSKVSLIAEVKRASPSKGVFAPHLDPVELARTYVANGVAAISVLTEPPFFRVSPHYLPPLKHTLDFPALSHALRFL